MFLSTCFLAFWIWQDFIFLAFWIQQDSFFLAFWIRQDSGFLNALIPCYNHSSLTVASGPFRRVFGVWFSGVVSVFVSGDSGLAACCYCLPKHTGHLEHFHAISATFVFENNYCHRYCIIHVLRNTAKMSFFYAALHPLPFPPCILFLLPEEVPVMCLLINLSGKKSSKVSACQKVFYLNFDIFSWSVELLTFSIWRQMPIVFCPRMFLLRDSFQHLSLDF